MGKVDMYADYRTGWVRVFADGVETAAFDGLMISDEAAVAVLCSAAAQVGAEIVNSWEVEGERIIRLTHVRNLKTGVTLESI